MDLALNNMRPFADYLIVTKDLLLEQLAILPGGYDRDGSPIIWFPKNCSNPPPTEESYRVILSYLIISSEFEYNYSFTFLMDLREMGNETAQKILNVIRNNLTSYTQQVVMVQNEICGTPDKSTTDDRGFAIVKTVMKSLPSLIRPDQLPVELGGCIQYDHASWLYEKVGYLWQIEVVDDDTGDIKNGKPGSITIESIQYSDVNDFPPGIQSIRLVDAGYHKIPGVGKPHNIPNEIETKLRELCEEANKKRLQMPKD